MVAGGALARAKGLLLDLVNEAYRRRERVALLCFGGSQVDLRLSPRRASLLDASRIAPIGGGGGTPLSAAVQQAGQLLSRHASGPRRLWLITDGRSREQPARPACADMATIVDFESGRMTLGRARVLAEAWQADYLIAPQAITAP